MVAGFKSEYPAGLNRNPHEPGKNWKFSLADVEERKFWKQYMKAYEACLSQTSTTTAPWYVVPADDKESARLIVSQILLDMLEALKMAYPKASADREAELLSIRKQGYRNDAGPDRVAVGSDDAMSREIGSADQMRSTHGAVLAAVCRHVGVDGANISRIANALRPEELAAANS